MTKVVAGLRVEAVHYPPRVSHYSGSEAALRAAKLLPTGFLFPMPGSSGGGDYEGFCSKSWVKGTHTYHLRKRAVDADHHSRQDYRADHWLLIVIREEHAFSDDLVAIRARELLAASRAA